MLLSLFHSVMHSLTLYSNSYYLPSNFPKTLLSSINNSFLLSNLCFTFCLFLVLPFFFLPLFLIIPLYSHYIFNIPFYIQIIIMLFTKLTVYNFIIIISALLVLYFIIPIFINVILFLFL